MKNQIQDFFLGLNACHDARQWVKDNQYSYIGEVIENVERGDWLLWLGKKMDVPSKTLILAKIRCAKTVTHLMRNEKSIYAINLAERFILNYDEVTFHDLYKAFHDLDKAVYEARYTNSYGYYASQAAADAAYYAAYAAYYEASSAMEADGNVACYADKAAVYEGYGNLAPRDRIKAKTKNEKETAMICKEVFGDLLIELVNKHLSPL